MTIPNTTCLYPHLARCSAYKKGCRCLKCSVHVSEKLKNYYAQHREKLKAVRRKVTAEQTPHSKAMYNKKQTERRSSPEGKAWRAAYNNDPQVKAHKKACSAAYIQTPHGKAASAANCAKRRALKRKQSPKLNDTEQQQVIEIYKRCQELTESTGIPHHVDHIIPLSKEGEHHPDNLQILTAEQNMKKGDRILP